MRREALVALFLVAGCGMPKTAPPPQPEAQPAAPALSPPAADLETTDEERSAEKPGPSGGSDAGAELDALDEEDATPAFEDEEEETVQLGGSDEEEEIQLTDSGVGVLELRRGSGSEAKPGTRITVRRGTRPARLIRLGDRNFVTAVKEKFDLDA